MNIEQAKGIPMSEILNKLNCKPVKTTDRGYWYLSPIRIEKTASFHTSNHHNVWYDFGLGKGGDSIAFVREFLRASNESDTVSDALRWLKNMIGGDVISMPVFVAKETNKEPTLELKQVTTIKHLGLRNFLTSRGIPIAVGIKYLKQVEVFNKTTNRSIISLGLINEENGYELRNPAFKGSVGAKAISFIRGNQPKPNGVNIFEGMFDYLSVITALNGKNLENDAIILNSTSLLKQAVSYIKNYGYEVAYSWMDNDDAGLQAAKTIEEICRAEEQLIHKPMHSKYSSYNDLNAWHMKRLNLVL
jgi:Toprim-like/CHC2 zinc finger